MFRRGSVGFMFMIMLQLLGDHRAFGQLFRSAQVASGSEATIYRCRKEDILPNNKLVLQRLEWAKACHVVPEHFLTNAKYDVGDVHAGEPERVAKALYLFPSFAYRYDTARVWKPNVDPVNGMYDCTIPEGVIWYTTCAAGCFAPDTKLRFLSGDRTIEQAQQQNYQDLLVLGAESMPGAMHWLPAPAITYVRDEQPSLQSMLLLQLESNAQLYVTPEHVFVSGEGEYVRSYELKSGSTLLAPTGKPIAVVHVEERQDVIAVMHVQPHVATSYQPLFQAGDVVSAGVNAQTSSDLAVQRLMFRSSLAASIRE